MKKFMPPPLVLRELSTHDPTREFVQLHVKPITFRYERDKKRFDRLVRRWSKKVDLKDIADLQVFIAYRFFTESNEALYANKDAEEKLSSYGNVRDIARLFELAEEKRLFTRKDSINFLESLLRLKAPYRKPYIETLLSRLKVM